MAVVAPALIAADIFRIALILQAVALCVAETRRAEQPVGVAVVASPGDRSSGAVHTDVVVAAEVVGTGIAVGTVEVTKTLFLA